MHHAMNLAVEATMHELERALLEHPIPKSPTEALMAIRGEVDEVACAISVGDMTGPHGYMAELPQVAAVAIKALMAALAKGEDSGCGKCISRAFEGGSGGDGMSHTPGPWKFEVVEETDSFLGCKWLDGGDGSTVIDLSDEWVGYPECGQDLQMTISKDDAALIAAAPEMLVVLEELRESASYWSEYDVPLGIVEKIESAIRKARGEE